MEKISKEYLASLINVARRPIVLDVGCYDCRDSAELAKLLVPNSCFYCFDADPRSYDLALRTVEKTQPGRWHVYNYALTDHEGVEQLYKSASDTRRHPGVEEWSASSSILPPKEHLNLFPDVSFQEPQPVECYRLDYWYTQKLKPFFIDLAWVDVNGSEEKFLRGGEWTLANKTRYLYIEFAEKELYSGQIDKQTLLEMLPSFEVMGVYDFQGNFGNVLLKNKNI